MILGSILYVYPAESIFKYALKKKEEERSRNYKNTKL